MSPGRRTKRHRFGRLALCLLLAAPTTGPWLDYPLMDAYAEEQVVDYSSLRSVAEVRAAAERSIALARSRESGADNLPELGGERSDMTLENASNAQELPAVDRHALDDPLVRQPVVPMARPEHDENPLGDVVVALADNTVDDESLDDVRGGFELPDSDLKFSFGIERAVFINGELVATTVLNPRDLTWVAGGEAVSQVVTSGAASAAVGVIQNGPGNLAAQVGSNLTHTVIQNTLDGQTIQNVTTINATVNSAQVMRTLSVQSAVQQGIINSLRH